MSGTVTIRNTDNASTDSAGTMPQSSTRGGHLRRFIIALIALAGLLVFGPSIAAQASTAGLATTGLPTAAAANYGESASMSCSRGEMVFNRLSVPASEFAGGNTVYYVPVVYAYYSGGWHQYEAMEDSAGYSYNTISSTYAEVYREPNYYASVPLGYYYRIYVYVANTNPSYAPHYDPAIIYGGGGSGYLCSASA